MEKTLPILVCALLVLSTSSRLHAQNANLAVETSRWPPFKATIDGPFPVSNYNDPPIIKSVSLERFAKFSKLNKFILTEKLSVEREKNGFLIVRPRFRFAGPELESRRIEVEVEALDSSGQVLSKAYSRCSDARLVATKPVRAASSTTIQAVPFNEPVFELELPVGVDKSAIRVEVEFREPEPRG
jgi:hypothetical protein